MSKPKSRPADILARMRGTVAEGAGAKAPAPPSEALRAPARRPQAPDAQDSTRGPEGAGAAATPRRRTRPAPAPAAPPATPPPRAVKSDQRPVHFTLDLARDQHRSLRMAAIEHGLDASAIVRALLDEFEANAALAKRVLTRARRAG